ncbi:uncharacterized protein PV09_02503 [Verruconis gallopava]|uniref:F-box domain-containing protein n=1 Tax=Verruconis gallopava TaxID=253628 RepID=A0A0D2AIT7_9PEZI|nr:uncharacterized protein PV09_02503 [Verruconis gallopava]KIW06823.1 hypothetical protein PV09_02503 [Verruconis gallopava]
MRWRLKDAIWRTSSTFSRKDSKSSADAPSQPSQPLARTTISDCAVKTVFKTPELLELILVHLDQQELLRAQRVCRRWKDIICSSLPLRQKLYLSPAAKIDESIPVDNAWLKSRFPDLETYLLQGNPKWRPKFIKALGAQDFDRLGADFFLDSNASWKNMLLTQPPIKEVVVYSNIGDMSRPASKQSRRGAGLQLEKQRQPDMPSMEELIKASVTVKSATGVTMGMVIDAGIEARRRGAAAAKRRMSDRKDSGYISLDENRAEEIEVSVVEVTD